MRLLSTQVLSGAPSTDFRVEQVEGKGFGIVSIQDLRKGKKVISEKPLIDCPARLPLSSPSPEAARRFFEEKVAQLAPEQQEQFYSLSDWRSEQGHGSKNAYQIFLSNAMPKGRKEGDTGAGVFATACRINHSCLPNCHFSWCSAEGKQAVHVVADIKPGVELGVTYVEPFAPRSARMRRLQDRFGFECSCPVCSSDGNRIKESNEIRERLAALDAEIRQQTSGEKVMQGFEEFQQLMDQEGFTNPYFTGRLCYAVLQGSQLSSEHVQAIAEQGLRSFTICEGENGDRTVELRAWLPQN